MNYSNDAERVLREANNIVRQEWLTNGGAHAPMFMWTDRIETAALAQEALLEDVPVAPFEDARVMIMMPMSWYYESLESQGFEPDLEADDPMEFMPTFFLDSQALGGVDMVMGNALLSNRWLDATRSMVRAIGMATQFLGTVADREHEAYDFVRTQIHRLRLYVDSMARNADLDTSREVLTVIGDMATSRVMMLYPDLMVQMLACSLSFARWDSTRMLAYDLVHRAMHQMEQVGAEDDVFAVCGDRFAQRVAYLRHDLLRLSGDNEATDALDLA